jgi:hypothetical protein
MDEAMGKMGRPDRAHPWQRYAAVVAWALMSDGVSERWSADGFTRRRRHRLPPGLA